VEYPGLDAVRRRLTLPDWSLVALARSTRRPRAQ